MLPACKKWLKYFFHFSFKSCVNIGTGFGTSFWSFQQFLKFPKITLKALLVLCFKVI